MFLASSDSTEFTPINRLIKVSILVLNISDVDKWTNHIISIMYLSIFVTFLGTAAMHSVYRLILSNLPCSKCIK